MKKAKSYYGKNNIVSFLFPSLIGLFLFVIPISYDDSFVVPIAILAKALNKYLADLLPILLVYILLTTAFFSIIVKIFKPNYILKYSFLNNLLNVSMPWLLVRVSGGIFAFMVFYEVGPEFIVSKNTGSLVFFDLLPLLFCVFLFAGFLLPLLLNFGLLELVGSLLTKVMRPLFNLPGRSAIDSISSWLGDGSVGILLTTKQYREKHYTQKEAAIIATTFSAVSITFTLVVLAQVKLENMFLQFYAVVTFAGFVAAIIVPRIPPLKWKKDLFYDDTKRAKDERVIPVKMSAFSWGLHCALKKASKSNDIGHFIQDGSKNAIEMIFGVLPVVMGIGTIALVISEYTPIFSYLGAPFVPLLELLQVPYAKEASETIVVGFADMFIPSILISTVEADITRFIVAALSVTQLIYMSEVGALILGSKIPIKIWELFVIFILRTLVTLPIIAFLAHLIF